METLCEEDSIIEAVDFHPEKKGKSKHGNKANVNAIPEM